MRSTAEKIVDAFCTEGLKSKPFDAVNALLHDAREQALPLALLVLERIPAGGTFFDHLLSHLTEEEFRVVVDAAMYKLRQGTGDAMESVVAYASMQCPHLLTPYLRELFAIQPNGRAYYSQWPWRAADKEEVAALQDLILHATDADTRKRAWACLVDTRSAENIRFAGVHRQSVQVDSRSFEASAHFAGFDVDIQPPRRLHTAHSYHVVPPSDYVEALSRPPWLTQNPHPTWALDVATSAEDSFAGQLGGSLPPICSSCGQPLHLLLRLENADVLLGASLARIDLCTCLSCLGWESSPLFFSHDGAGNPTPLAVAAERVEPQFPSGPLQASAVHFVKSPARWAFQDWGLSNNRENLNRVGGAPTWIQSAEYPACPHCRRRMQFCAQLDSELTTAEGDAWLWGSGGICYMFWCDPCRVSANLWQCT